MEYKNSSGYFADPSTGEELSSDMERCVPCSFEDGKFTWPMVLLSDGTPVKIVYKYFTDEEKALYKAYRGRGTGEVRQSHPKSVAVEASVPATHIAAEPETEEGQFVQYDATSTPAAQTLEAIADCDQCLGVFFVSGLTYVLLGKQGTRRTWSIPRQLIPDEEFERICNAT